MRILPLAVLGAVSLGGGCGGGTGLDGADYDPIGGGSGLCYEVDIGDGIDGAAEISQLFDCLNQYGAFDELAPLVHYVLASDRVDAFVTVLSEGFTTFDVPGAIETVGALLVAPERPVDGVLAIYNEAYDDGLLPPMLAFTLVAAAEVDRCELDADPTACSAPRLLRALLGTDTLDRAGRVLSAIEHLPPDPAADPDAGMLDGLASLILAMQAANHPEQGNVLVDVGQALIDPTVEGGPPLLQLVDLLVPLIDDDRLIDALVSEIARIDRAGILDQLDDDIQILFTRDIAGNDVGFDGPTIFTSLTGVLGAADPSLLTEELTLPGGGEPVTLLDVALDMAEDLYQQDADIAAIVDELGDVAGLICGSDASSDLCELVDDMLPPLQAAVAQTTVVPELVLPLVHVLGTYTDLPAILDFLPRMLEWGLLGKTEPMLRYSVENNLLAGLPRLVPAFIDARLGRLRADGVDAIEIVRTLLHPLDPAAHPAAPVEILLPLLRAVLHPSQPDADPDRLMVLVATRLTNPDSALSADAIAALFEDLDRALELGQIDLLGVVRDLLDNTALWQSGAHLLADEQLIALLRPNAAGDDATGWLRDLIERGVLARLLDWVAALLRQVSDLGLLDLPEASPLP